MRNSGSFVLPGACAVTAVLLLLLLEAASGHPSCPSRPVCGCEQVYREVCQEPGPYAMDCGCGPFQAYCDMRGNWTVVQRRFNGAVNFYRNWTDYEEGFGVVRGEFWLGLRQIHCLTSTFPGTTLRVELETWAGRSYYAQYSHFSVKDSSQKYQLSLWGYSGTAGDQLSYHNNQYFSTFDKDSDGYYRNCASVHRGGWWYRSCVNSNLNGVFYTGGTSNSAGVTWSRAGGTSLSYSFRRAEMKVKLRTSI